jgi:hypothetical protein
MDMAVEVCVEGSRVYFARGIIFYGRVLLRGGFRATSHSTALDPEIQSQRSRAI